VRSINSAWQQIDLPEGSQPLLAWQQQDCQDENFLKVCDYLRSRGEAIEHGYDYWWCPQSRNQLNQRLLIPLLHGDTIVGYTARYFEKKPPSNIPRYWNSVIPQGYLFNHDVATKPNRQFIVVVEGPFDAIAVQGTAVMGSVLSEWQIHWLCQQGKQIIILPDREGKNQDLIDTALLFGWGVSFPDWEKDIKDAADACKEYGDIYTISSVLNASTTNPIEIGVRRKLLVY
jgi:hypothetical protein